MYIVHISKKRKIIINYLTNWMLNVFEIRRFCILSASRKVIHHSQSEISIATHSILLFQWMARTMNRKELNVLVFPFFFFLHKFNEICCVCLENCCLSHSVNVENEGAEQNQIFYRILYWILGYFQCTTLQQTYHNVHFSIGSRWC